MNSDRLRIALRRRNKDIEVAGRIDVEEGFLPGYLVRGAIKGQIVIKFTLVCLRDRRIDVDCRSLMYVLSKSDNLAPWSV